MEFILADDPLPVPPQPPVGGAGEARVLVAPGGGVQQQAAYIPAYQAAGNGNGNGKAGYHQPGGAARAQPQQQQQQQQDRMTQMTAFTDLMESAGFKRGEPFLGNNTASPLSNGSSPNRGGRR